MIVRMFQPRFAPLVESGRKRQTIRKTPARMPKRGDIISCREWLGKPYRSKQRELCRAKIKRVARVEVSIGVWVDDEPVPSENFAIADGFKSFWEMSVWVEATHGPIFRGIVIYW